MRGTRLETLGKGNAREGFNHTRRGGMAVAHDIP